MSRPRITRDIINLIFLQVTDSETWINLSQINRASRQLGKQLLQQKTRTKSYIHKYEFPYLVNQYTITVINGKETYTALPCGQMHGKSILIGMQYTKELLGEITVVSYYRDSEYTGVQRVWGRCHVKSWYEPNVLLAKIRYNNGKPVHQLWWHYVCQDIGLIKLGEIFEIEPTLRYGDTFEHGYMLEVDGKVQRVVDRAVVKMRALEKTTEDVNLFQD